MANGLRIPCGATARLDSARHHGTFAVFLCVNLVQLTGAVSAERGRRCCCSCVLPIFAALQSQRSCCPEKVRKLYGNGSRSGSSTGNGTAPAPRLPHSPNDDISSADQCHTVLPPRFTIRACCPWANLAGGRRSAVEMLVESSRGQATCGTRMKAEEREGVERESEEWSRLGKRDCATAVAFKNSYS